MKKLFTLQFPKEYQENPYINRSENAPVTFKYAVSVITLLLAISALFYLSLFFCD
jgi:hypothetical protein